MIRNLFILYFLLIVGTIQISAQTTSVAGWGIVALGNDHNHLPKIEGNAFATLIIHNEQARVFLMGNRNKAIIRSIYSFA